MIVVALCFATHAGFGQLGQQDSTSPLYGPRPELGKTTNGLPQQLREVGIDQHLDAQVPGDLVFRDENNKEVRLADYYGKKPIILSLAYYNCPMLCTQILNGLASSLKTLKFDVGREFEVVTVSFDPRETPQLAAEKKVNYIARYNRTNAAEGWHFLTGSEDSIKKLTDAVGFRYKWDEASQQFAHASGIMVLTPQGKISHYFYGVEYAPKDLRLALIEASENKIGSPVDQLLLYCYHYDPATGKYGPMIMNIVKLAGLATIIGMVALLFLLRRRGIAAQRLKAGGTA
jgi:protein SCO1/2